jgi:hypothetical protein
LAVIQGGGQVLMQGGAPPVAARHPRQARCRLPRILADFSSTGASGLFGGERCAGLWATDLKNSYYPQLREIRKFN